MDKERVIIKIGGLPASDDKVLLTLFQEMATMMESYAFIVVHGGGKEVTLFSEKLGLTAVFQDGIRITSTGEMRVVDMVLAGRVNTHLVRQARVAGLNPVGLGGQDGGLLEAEALAVQGYPDCRTGKVTSVQPEILNHLLEGGYLPILHSTAQDRVGHGLNINADEAALAVAAALWSKRLIYISDVSGVKNGDVLLSTINEALAEELIENEIISGGMIPKIRSSITGVKQGIGGVIIGDYTKPGDLKSLLDGTKGTVIQ